MTKQLGRPTLYNEDMQKRADNYVHVYDDKVEEGGCGEAIPTAAGLACYLGVSKVTCYEWAKHYPDFSNTLAEINTCQEQRAVNCGITGVFNSTITKLLLANHGYSDKQAVDHTSSDGSMTPKGKSLDDFYGDDVPVKS